MNAFEIAAVVLIAITLPCLGVCVFAGARAALAAFEVASTVATTALMALADGFHRQPFIDLAVVFAPMSLVGSLMYARLMERDL